ncbi:ABC transporter substrate-binding protein [Nocardioides sp. GY 10127]|uniref:ABC transporter substrate-binding protein n=1 Tax=Nocardioides sp. GY 10127 TaxID=2569762 RepID=UPI0010A7F0CF|nr:ABC transporter substrate-binding protein [Nocardioides sp. GY 10127]TIC81773.1 ABC transporter substrate-binding protein [Nocardioides sp. GY 10127]
MPSTTASTRVRRSLALALTFGLAASAAACGDLGGADTASDSTTIKVGFVTPLTGNLAAFGAPDEWVVDQMQSYFDENPISAGGTDYDVQIIVKDSQSDPTRAAEVAGELINTDGVDVVMAHATPDTTVPVSDQCEANSTPCITDDTPWQPWYYGRGGTDDQGFDWTYHFFWGLEDVASTYENMWDQVDTNKKVAALWPNDADGQAWSAAFPDLVKDGGYTLDDPGLFESGTQDYSAQIAQFKKNGDDILLACVTPPDFAAFWQQAQQQGYTPKVATVARAIEFPAAVDALGDGADGLATEVWWAPQYDTTSTLLGQSSQEFADAYEADTGNQWSMPLGFSEALFEVLAAAVEEAGSNDKQAIVDALSTLSTDTLVGPVDFTSGPVPNVAKTPLAGGQWSPATDGDFTNQLTIVANNDAPQVAVEAQLAALK